MKKNKDLGAFLKIHELRFPKWIGPSGIRRWWQTGPKKGGGLTTKDEEALLRVHLDIVRGVDGVAEFSSEAAAEEAFQWMKAWYAAKQSGGHEKN